MTLIMIMVSTVTHAHDCLSASLDLHLDMHVQSTCRVELQSHQIALIEECCFKFCC